MTTRRSPLALSLALALLALAPLAPAQEATQIPHIEGGIVVDGVLDESAWSQATVIDLPYEISPADNTPAPVRTTMRMATTRIRRRSARTSPTATVPSATTSSA